MNSILAHTLDKKGDKLSEVRLAYNGAVRGNRAMLLVEGKDDEAFYKRFAAEENLYVYAMNGCDWMETVLNKMNLPKRRKIAGIKDADFDVLNGNIPTEPGLFLTDCHDYEMLCANQNSCTLVATSYGMDVAEASRLHDNILNNLIAFSQIKWYCSLMRITYSYLSEAPDNISFAKCKAANHYGLSTEQSLFKVNLRQNRMYAPLNIQDLTRFAQRHKGTDLKMLVNGHDYCAALGLELRKHTKKNIKDKEIPVTLAEKYELKDFISTSVAKATEAYFSPTHIWRNE